MRSAVVATGASGGGPPNCEYGHRLASDGHEQQWCQQLERKGRRSAAEAVCASGGGRTVAGGAETRGRSITKIKCHRGVDEFGTVWYLSPGTDDAILIAIRSYAFACCTHKGLRIRRLVIRPVTVSRRVLAEPGHEAIS